MFKITPKIIILNNLTILHKISSSSLWRLRHNLFKRPFITIIIIIIKWKIRINSAKAANQILLTKKNKKFKKFRNCCRDIKKNRSFIKILSIVNRTLMIKAIMGGGISILEMYRIGCRWRVGILFLARSLICIWRIKTIYKVINLIIVFL